MKYISKLSSQWQNLKILRFQLSPTGVLATNAHSFLWHSLVFSLFRLFFFDPCFSHSGFPDNSADKESTCNEGDLGSVPGQRRSPGEGKGYPLQYSGLENSMDCIIRPGGHKETQLSDFHFTFSYSVSFHWTSIASRTNMTLWMVTSLRTQVTYRIWNHTVYVF